jgi:hypothetical protein
MSSDGRRTVRRDRRRDGTLRPTGTWSTYGTDGVWDGTHESWAEAMDWVTSPTARIEYYANNASGTVVKQ